MFVSYLLRGLLLILVSVSPGLFHSLPVYALTIAAIGDSFASGEGNPDEPQRFDWLGFVKKGPVWTDRQCHRSHTAAPEKAAMAIADSLGQPLEFINLACTGARLDRGVLEPYDPETDNTHNPLPSQIDALRTRIGDRPIDILLISAGGNDVGFADIIKQCIKMDSLALVRRNNELCSRDPGVLAAIKHELGALPQKYDRLADQLKSMQIGQVMITEYPDPTKGANGSYCGENGNSRILFLHPLTAKWADHEIVFPLNAAVGAAAERHGWIRVPVQAWSTKQGYCAGNARWFRTEEDARNIQGPHELGLSFRDRLPPGFQFSLGSLHPNPAGHDGIARQILAAFVDAQALKSTQGLSLKPKLRYGHLDVFVVGHGGGAYWTHWNDEIWQPWGRIGGSGDTFPERSTIAPICRQPDQCDIFVVGNDGRVYTTYWNKEEGWHHTPYWTRIGNADNTFPVGSPVTAVTRKPDQIDLFVVGHNGGIYTTYWNPADGWTGNHNWFRIGGPSHTFPLKSTVAAIARKPDQLDLFVQGNEGAIHSIYWNPQDGWETGHTWFQIGGSGDTFPAGCNVTAVTRKPDQIDLFVVGHNGGIYTTYWNPTSGWNHVPVWLRLGSPQDTFPIRSPIGGIDR
jgi:hypothetical protein